MTINKPEAVTKPLSTGWLKKPATKPMRKAPMIKSMAPTMTASNKLAAQKSALPWPTTAPTAASDMMERKAAGPKPKVGLVPMRAYTTKGNMLAYKPVTAGRPASKA